MPFQKGRAKTGGRTKGSPTRLAREAQARIEELGGDPIAVMVEISMDKRAAKPLRLKAASELAQYIYPKRKAIEHSGPDGSPIEKHDSAIELLADRIDGIATALRAGSNAQSVN